MDTVEIDDKPASVTTTPVHEKNETYNNIDNNIDKDYELVCCEKSLINIPPKTVLAFIVTILVICVLFGFLKGNEVVVLPIITGLTGVWVPSPLQPSNRREALQSNNLLQNNLHLSRALLKFNNQQPQQPLSMNINNV